MKIDWQRMAEARGLGLTPSELDRIVPVLARIESALSPLAAGIPHETEPAVVLSEAAVVGE